MDPTSQQCIEKEHIQDYLAKVHACIQSDNFQIALDSKKRKENVEFKNEFRMSDQKFKELFMSLEADDFSHTLQNEHKAFKHEVLYVFRKDGKFVDIDEEEQELTLYIKINLVEVHGVNAFFISCHRINYPLEYYFK